jgi:hypothetical protein
LQYHYIWKNKTPGGTKKLLFLKLRNKIVEMDIKNIGFLAIAIGITLLIVSVYLNIQWLQYLSILILIIGGLLVNYKKILKSYKR